MLSNCKIGASLNIPVKNKENFIVLNKATENDIVPYKVTLDSLVENYLCNAFMCTEIKSDNLNHKNDLSES